ncbi:MAG: serine hydrolase domain-containing protein [Bacteroidota bacterium]
MIRFVSFGLLLIFLFLCPIPSRAQYIDLNRMEQVVDSIIQKGLDSLAFPGAQLLVARGGHILLSKAYGHHTYARQRPVQRTDLYDLASITKVSTGLPILMKLYGEGKLSLDKSLGECLPYFKNSDKAPLRLRELLSHQAGMQPYIVYWQDCFRKNGRAKWGYFRKRPTRSHNIYLADQLYLRRKYPRKIRQAIKKSPLSTEKKYRYSGLFFQLLPQLIEGLTAADFETYLQQEIFDPIGANSLCFRPSLRYPLTQIVPTERDTFFRHQLVHGQVHDEAAAMLGGVSCNAGLFGTAEDLAKLFQLYLNKGQHNGQQLIPAAAVDTFTRRHYADNDNRRGLGFDKPLLQYNARAAYIAKDASPSSFGHSGFTGTFVWADPEHQLLVVLLTNRVHPHRSNRKLYQLNLRPDLHQAIYDSLQR